MGVMPLPSVANNVAVCYTETDPYMNLEGSSIVMNCPFCGAEMIQGKVCSRWALWWQSESHRHRLNDEGGLVAKLNGYRVTAYRCEKCKKIIVDDK